MGENIQRFDSHTVSDESCSARTRRDAGFHGNPHAITVSIEHPRHRGRVCAHGTSVIGAGHVHERTFRVVTSIVVKPASAGGVRDTRALARDLADIDPEA